MRLKSSENEQVSFQIIILMRGLPNMRFDYSESEPKISSSNPQSHYCLFF